MKTRVYIIAILSMLSIAGYAVNYTPTQEWKTTSPMMMSGSALSPQVTEVGAEYAASVATTTETYSPNNAPGRRFFPKPGETGQSEEFPIGDAVLPLALMATVFAGVIALRRKRKAKQYD